MFRTCHNTACDTVDTKKLRRLVRRIDALHGSDRKSRELETVAKALGRKQVKHGSYTWESDVFPNLPPLSIPHHSKRVKRFTAEGILDQLVAQDVFAWEEKLRAKAQRQQPQQSTTEETDNAEA